MKNCDVNKVIYNSHNVAKLFPGKDQCVSEKHTDGNLMPDLKLPFSELLPSSLTSMSNKLPESITQV